MAETAALVGTAWVGAVDCKGGPPGDGGRAGTPGRGGQGGSGELEEMGERHVSRKTAKR